MLSARDAFKAGFLSRCVEDRVPPERIAVLAKTANDLMEKHAILDGLVSGVGDAAKGLFGTAAKYGIPAALLAPPLLGGAAGYGAAKMTDIGDIDVDDVKNQEVVDEYQRQTEKLRRLKAVRDAAKSRPRLARDFI